MMSEVLVIRFNDDVLKALEDVLHCRICKGYYNYCVMAVCGHNFCAHCIRKRMRTDQDCPFCFEVINEADLRNNKVVDKMVRIYEKLKSKSKRDTQEKSAEKMQEIKVEVLDDFEMGTGEVSVDRVNGGSVLISPMITSDNSTGNNTSTCSSRETGIYSNKRKATRSVENDDDGDSGCTPVDMNTRLSDLKKRLTAENDNVHLDSDASLDLKEKLRSFKQQLKEKDKKISELVSLNTELKEKAANLEKLNMELTRSLMGVVNSPKNFSSDSGNAAKSYDESTCSMSNVGANTSSELLPSNSVIEYNDSQSSIISPLEESSEFDQSGQLILSSVTRNPTAAQTNLRIVTRPDGRLEVQGLPTGQGLIRLADGTLQLLSMPVQSSQPALVTVQAATPTVATLQTVVADPTTISSPSNNMHNITTPDTSQLVSEREQTTQIKSWESGDSMKSSTLKRSKYGKDRLDIDLNELLDKCTVGRYIKAQYERRKYLDQATRQKLVGLIVNEVIDQRSKTARVKHSEFEEIALKIVEQFPTESAYTYYIPPYTESPYQKISKGKLVDKFRNNLRLYKSANILPRRKDLKGANNPFWKNSQLLFENKGQQLVKLADGTLKLFNLPEQKSKSEQGLVRTETPTMVTLQSVTTDSATNFSSLNDIHSATAPDDAS